MRIRLENIGKVKNADIEIDKVTVLAGENNTGKSTVGKALWAAFNGMHNLEEKVYEQRVFFLNKRLRRELHDFLFSRDRVTARAGFYVRDYCADFLKRVDINDTDVLMSKVDDFRHRINSLFSEGGEDYDVVSSETMQKILEELQAVGSLDVRVVDTQIEKEFRRQVLKQDERHGVITLVVKGREIDISFDRERILPEMKNITDFYATPYYFDDPFLFDRSFEEDESIRYRSYSTSPVSPQNHRMHLNDALSSSDRKGEIIEEELTRRKLTTVLDTLNEIVPGALEIAPGGRNFQYMSSELSEPLEMSNVSAGLKTFSIVKELLYRGLIEEGGTLILDEPEVHLHPEWQVRFAEIIVLLAKEFDLHILMTTHSPYFLNAIEAYSKKHSISEGCHFYNAKNEDDGVIFDDVTDDVEAIYRAMARPFHELESLEVDMNQK